MIKKYIKDWSVFAGKKFSSLLMLYGIGIVALFFFQLFEFYEVRDEANLFYTFATSLESSFLGAVSIVLFMSTRNLINNMKTKYAFYLSVENRVEVFKNYNYTILFLNLLFILIFVITTYLAAAIVGILPSFWIMKLIIDLVCACLVYVTLSFTVLIKKPLLIFIPGVLFSAAISLLKIKVIPENVISMFLIAAVTGIVAYFANKTWLKLLNKYYSEL